MFGKPNIVRKKRGALLNQDGIGNAATKRKAIGSNGDHQRTVMPTVNHFDCHAWQQPHGCQTDAQAPTSLDAHNPDSVARVH